MKAVQKKLSTLSLLIGLWTGFTVYSFDPMNNTGYRVESVSQAPGTELIAMDNQQSLVALTDKVDDAGRPKLYRYSDNTFNVKHTFEGTDGFDYAINASYFVRKPAGNILYTVDASSKESEYRLNLDAYINKIVASKMVLDNAFIAHGKGASIISFDKLFSRKDIPHRPTRDIIELSNPHRILLMGADQTVVTVDMQSLKMGGLSVCAHAGCSNKDGSLLALANINYSNDIQLYEAKDLEKPLKKMSIASGDCIFNTYHMAFANKDKWLVSINANGGEVNLFDIDTEHKLFNVNCKERLTTLIIPDATIMPYIAIFKSWKGNWMGLLKNESNDNI